MVDDPYHVRMPTAELSRIAEALTVVDRHAELNHRYRALIHDSRKLLADEDVRLTQARGMAKKLMVLVRAAGTNFREDLAPQDNEVLGAGLAQADELVYGNNSRSE